MPRPCTISKEIQSKIESGKHTLLHLSKESNIPYSTLYSFAKRNNFNFKQKSYIGKTVKDHDLFKSWNINNAYLLGFLLADGCLHPYNKKRHSYSIEVSLALKDFDHLQKIKILFNSTNPINQYNNNGYGCKRLMIYSKEIYNDLICLGVTPKKTYTATWMESWPEEYIPHILRGFFDGDGSIHIRSYKNRSQGSIYISFSGTESIMTGIQASFAKFYGKAVGSVYRADDGPYYYYVMNGNRISIAFCEWIYNNSTDENRMERKYNVYKEYMENYVKNPRTHLYINRG